jgi:TonB family protein
MKHLNLTFICIILLSQVSFAQDGDTGAVFTIKVRKPEVKLAGKVSTSGEFSTTRYWGSTFLADTVGRDTLSGWEIEIEYPAEARELGISGVVYVGYQYNRKGKTRNVFLVNRVHPALDEAALNYVLNMQAGDSAKKGIARKDLSTVEPGFAIIIARVNYAILS